MKTLACSSWAEFREHLLRFASLSRDAQDAFIFRGQRDSDWKLESTLDRHFPALTVEERREKSDRLLHGFARELYGIDDRELIEDADRIEYLARHHGLPTRIIDWSRSPYVAAYFAMEGSEEPSSKTVAVWCFDTRLIPLSPDGERPIIDDMSLIGHNDRAIEQRGVFMRLSVGVAADTVLADGLWKYTIPQSERRVALCELDAMMITARTLFRNRDAAARTALIRETLR